MKRSTQLSKRRQRGLISITIIIVLLLGLTACQIGTTTNTPAPQTFVTNPCTVSRNPQTSGRVTNIPSGIYSGYTEPRPTVSKSGDESVCAKWKIPQHIECPTTMPTNQHAGVNMWAGIPTPSKLVQAGTDYECTGNVWTAFYEVANDPHGEQQFSISPQPGDAITVSVSYHADVYNLTVSDDTQKRSQTVEEDAIGEKPTTGAVMLESPTRLPTGKPEWLASFGTVTFTNCLLNGQPWFTFPLIDHWEQHGQDINGHLTNLINTQDKPTGSASFTISFLSS